MPTNPSPSFKWENEARSAGYALVGGIDEVGRGALAGPVCAATVVLPPYLPDRVFESIDDSKVLTAAQRLRAFDSILEVALSVGLGESGPGEIDQIGISAATKFAMRRAVSQSAVKPHILLVDAINDIGVDVPCLSIIKGDAQSMSISAASIVAKVHRDELMSTKWESLNPEYGFAKHKGYGTRQHLDALRRHGACPAHRRSFRPIRERDDHRQ